MRWEFSSRRGWPEHTDTRRRTDRIGNHRRIAGTGAKATHVDKTAFVDLEQIGTILVRHQRDGCLARERPATARAPRPSMRPPAGAMTSIVHPVCSAAARIAPINRAGVAAATTGAGAPRTRRPAGDAPTICGVFARHEVARRLPRQHALNLVSLERRKLEPPHFGERRHERDRERSLRHAERAR